MNTYYIILTSMAVMAVIVFVALFYFKAGYGYLSTSKWGPKIGNKTAWVIMEAPAFIVMLYYTLRFDESGVETCNCRIVLDIVSGHFLLHYLIDIDFCMSVSSNGIYLLHLQYQSF